MIIQTIYQHYAIPPNLQLHMLRAAAVGSIIADNWKDKKQIDKHMIIQTLLLHDTGNIIKFDLEKFPELLSPEIKRNEYWKEKQKEFINKYGNDEHHAILAIAKEIGVNNYLLNLLDHMGTSKLQHAVETHDYNQKISCYCDFRSGPFGIVTVNIRFDDLLKRYKGRQHPNASVEKMENGRRYCLELEKQLQENLKFDLQALTDESVKKEIEKLGVYYLITD